MTESEYKVLVLADYDRKCKNNKLPAELVSPSPGNLKAEATRICERRFDQKDELLLQSFFNQKEGASGYRTAILNCNAELFRPVVKLLKEREINTQIRFVNLLAWLIDFRYRPFRFDMVIKETDNTSAQQDDFENGSKLEKTSAPGRALLADGNIHLPATRKSGSDTQSTNKDPKPGKPEPDTRPRRKLYIRWFVAAGIALSILIIGLIKAERNNCMYWSDDHYIATSCSIPRGDVPLIEFNRDRFKNFRKVKHTDTLSRNSIGHLWYTRVGDSLDVFTMEGKHPLFRDKELKALNDFAINFSRNRKNKIGGR